ncbi:TPA: hypothetical protein DEP21_02325 [Patescibacteria group bacterium]|nr:hypothetical protein [Candidatus Gracilibacteria bacterium]
MLIDPLEYNILDPVTHHSTIDHVNCTLRVNPLTDAGFALFPALSIAVTYREYVPLARLFIVYEFILAGKFTPVEDKPFTIRIYPLRLLSVPFRENVILFEFVNEALFAGPAKVIVGLVVSITNVTCV